MSTRTLLIAVEMVAASIWIGSLVCLAIVSRVATRSLDGASRVVLFRGVGRLYGIVGTASLGIAIGAGLVLAAPLRDLTADEVALFALAGGLVLATAAGMIQAQKMTAVRQRLVVAPNNQDAADAVRRGAVLAQALRCSLVAITLVIVVLGAAVING